MSSQLSAPAAGRLGEGCINTLWGQDEVLSLVRQHSLSLCLGKCGVQVLQIPAPLPTISCTATLPASARPVKHAFTFLNVDQMRRVQEMDTSPEPPKGFWLI